MVASEGVGAGVARRRWVRRVHLLRASTNGPLKPSLYIRADGPVTFCHPIDTSDRPNMYGLTATSIPNPYVGQIRGLLDVSAASD